jgi:Glycosyltransferase family 87
VVNTMARYLVLGLLCAALALLFFEIRIGRGMRDFAVYRQAATRALYAEPLYRPEDGHYQFKYLPIFAYAMAPFAWFSEDDAKTLWYALSCMAGLMLVYWSIRLLPERRLPSSGLFWLTLCCMAKFYGRELALGQANIVFGALLLGALGALGLAFPAVTGLCVAAAFFIKPYGVLFVPWLVVTAGRRAIVTFLAVVSIGATFPALVYGWSGNLELFGDWYRTVTSSTAPNLLGSDNISLAGMWAKWLGSGAAAATLAVVSSLAALGLGVVVWLKRAAVPSPAYLEVALLMLLVPLLSPQGWDYVLLLATPAVVCLIDRWHQVGRRWQWLTGLALATMGFTVFDVMGRTLYECFMATSAISVCAILLAIALTHLRCTKLA